MADKSPISKGSLLLNHDVERGKLETWPVGTSVRSHAPIPKPQFLQHLENYLERELRLLGCPPQGPSELRLQAHREVFERLIEDFKTYKPLMSAIKREYDLFILHQNDIIKELLPLQTKIEAIRDENEKKLMDMKEEEKKQDEGVRNECSRLKCELQTMKTQELTYKAQIEKLQDELSILYGKYRNEADARKLLISDYNELRARQNEQHEGDGAGEKEDPIILKLQLARTKEDLRACHMKINTMLADYGDVVPRGDFDMLNTAYKTLENELEVLKGQLSDLMGEHDTLLVMYKDIQIQRDRTLNELTRIKGSATPRPDWSRCAEFIEGGLDKWAEISEGRTSDELVDVLLSQIAGVDISEVTRHEVFQGQGLSAHVPMYLRCEGVVSNRRMGRNELEDIVRGFWEYRTTRIAEGRGDGRSYPIDTLLYEYLLARNDGNEEMAIEDGYNLQDACTRYSHECHIGIFYNILQGEVMDEVYDGWVSTQVALMEHFSKSDTDHKKTVSQQQLHQLLTSLFPNKSVGDVAALVQCAQSSAGNGNIDYIKLMHKTKNGAPSKFVVLLLEQRRSETQQYVSDIRKAIGAADSVPAGDLMKVLRMVDPHKPSSEVQMLMSKMYSTPLGQINDTATIATDRLLRYLTASNAVRSS